MRTLLLLLVLVQGSGCMYGLRDNGLLMPRAGEALYSPAREPVELVVGVATLPLFLAYEALLLVCAPIVPPPTEALYAALAYPAALLDPTVNLAPDYRARDLPALRRLLEREPESHVRYRIVRTIEGIRPIVPAQQAMLMELLGHEDDGIRRLAVESIGEVGPPARTIPALIERLGDRYHWVRHEAAGALVDVVRGCDVLDQRLEGGLRTDAARRRWLPEVRAALVRQREVEPHPEVRSGLDYCLRVLGEIELAMAQRQ